MSKAMGVQNGAHPDQTDRVEVEEFHEHTNAVTAFFFWVKSWALPGSGMFCEAYFIFSIGNLKPIFTQIYPRCYSKPHTDCSAELVDSQTYTQVVGIMLGMLSLGFIADKVGRKWGSVACAAFMFVGGILLTASSAPTLYGWAVMFSVSQFIYGYGVGGEYPLASSSAAERAEANKSLRFRRGEMIVCTFAMQGWGNFVNTAIICILLAIFGQTSKTYNNRSLEAVWRLSFGLGLIPVTGMLIYRLFFLQESKVWIRKKHGPDHASREQSVMWYHYWHRLVGTAGAWFFWDVSFYGNKLFQSTFISIIAPGSSILTGLLWTLLNSFVALVGYYFAAFTIDKMWMGRVRLQIMGFCWVFVIFLVCAIAYNDLVKPQYIQAFQFLYFFSSFWGQFGPNATTWMLPGEIFPTEVRATCHGISAATGKAGALVAGIWFAYLTPAGRFYVSAFFNLAGLLLTALFVPNIISLDLREGDRRWDALMSKEPYAYTGEAVNPKNMSLFERLVGCSKHYDPEADRRKRKDEGIQSAGNIEATKGTGPVV